MRFWDASALVSVLVPEVHGDRFSVLLAEGDAPVVWWATSVECASAIARLARTGHLDRSGAEAAADRLRDLEARWSEIAPTAVLRENARGLLAVHPLRAADALQLAAALAAADGDPERIGFVCLDRRLADAARREGFAILPE